MRRKKGAKNGERVERGGSLRERETVGERETERDGRERESEGDERERDSRRRELRERGTQNGVTS